MLRRAQVLWQPRFPLALVQSASVQTTSDGKPKILDIVDGTGSGDVDTSQVVKLAPDGVTLQGLHGTTLEINPAWKNPTGKWRVGAKPVFELYPGGCKSRMTQRRKVKLLTWHCAVPTPSCSLASSSRRLWGPGKRLHHCNRPAATEPERPGHHACPNAVLQAKLGATAHLAHPRHA